MKKWVILLEGEFEYKSDHGKTVDENIKDFLNGVSYEGTDIKKEYNYNTLDDGILLIEIRVTVEISSDSSNKNDVIVGFIESLKYDAKVIRLDYSIKCKS